MCDPTTIFLASAGMQAGGQVLQGRGQKMAADFDADQLGRAAAGELDTAALEARRIRRAGEAQRGETVAALAGAGVEVGQGSALEVERRVVEDAMMDEQIALLTGERRARGLRTQSVITRQQGRMARDQGFMNAATSLLSSGANYGRANGWRTGGPGFSGQQAPAPVTDRSFRG